MSFKTESAKVLCACLAFSAIVTASYVASANNGRHRTDHRVQGDRELRKEKAEDDKKIALQPIVIDPTVAIAGNVIPFSITITPDAIAGFASSTAVFHLASSTFLGNQNALTVVIDTTTLSFPGVSFSAPQDIVLPHLNPGTHLLQFYIGLDTGASSTASSSFTF